MASSNGMKSMYKSVDPQYPDCEGKQFAGDSMTPEYIDISYDEYNNEIPESRGFNHSGNTAGKGSFNFSGGHYSDDWNGGYSNYGSSVGKPAEGSRTSVDVSKADRGKDS